MRCMVLATLSVLASKPGTFRIKSDFHVSAEATMLAPPSRLVCGTAGSHQAEFAGAEYLSGFLSPFKSLHQVFSGVSRRTD